MLLCSPNKSNPLLWRLAGVSIANAAGSVVPSSAAPSPCLRLGDGSGAAAAAGIPQDAPPGFPEGLSVPAANPAFCPAVCLSVHARAPGAVLSRSRPAVRGWFILPRALAGKARWEPDKRNLVCEREGLSSCFFIFFFFPLLLFFLFFRCFPLPSREAPSSRGAADNGADELVQEELIQSGGKGQMPAAPRAEITALLWVPDTGVRAHRHNCLRFPTF